MSRLNPLSALLLLASAAVAPSAFAQVQSVDIGINPTYQQTGQTTVISTGGFFSGRVFTNTPNDYSGGTLSWPGPASPQNLSAAPGPALVYAPPGYATLASLNGAYPTGSYSFDLDGANQPSQTDTIDYSVAADSNIAALTAASYDEVTNAAGGQALSIDLAAAMAPSSNANMSNLYLTLYDLTTGDDSVYSYQAPSISDTSFTLPSGILVGGDQYQLDINFDDRITGADSNSVPTTIFFDTHTDVNFAAAVPEPATWAMLLLGIGGLGLALRARRRNDLGALRASVRPPECHVCRAASDSRRDVRSRRRRMPNANSPQFLTGR